MRLWLDLALLLVSTRFRQSPVLHFRLTTTRCLAPNDDLQVPSRTQDYATYWDELLLIEHSERVEDFRDRRKNWSRKRLEDSGMSIFGACAEPESDLFGEKIVRIVKKHEKRFRDKFARGDVLVLTTQEEDDLPRECLVVDVGTNWLTIGVGPNWPMGLWESRKLPGRFPVRLDRSVSQSPLRAQRSALSLVRKGTAGKAAHYLETTFASGGIMKDDQVCLTYHTIPEIRTALREVVYEASFQPNAYQQDSICWALQHDISIIRGPPGTGKTRVAALLVATLRKLKDKEPTEMTRVLAVTHSNGAADVLLEALLQVGVPAVRIGRPASVSAKVQHRTAAAMAERHPEVLELRAAARDMKISSHDRSAALRQLQQCLINVQQSIIEAAPVVVASCIGAFQLMNDESTFSTVVLDEAAQTTEPALICAVASVRAKRLVLVGDTRQLPPTITSIRLRDTLGVSPMARLEALGLPVQTLQLQYRMPTTLLEHPSKYFYNGLVKSSETVYQGPPPKGFAWPSDLPLAFVNVGTDLERSHEFSGRSNPTEVKIVLNIVQDMLSNGEILAENIVVLSPYSKQVQLLRSELCDERICVGTIDSFQGQETDVVIFSCVRSNEFFELGFLRDSRRLCVALTRARRGLILVGDTLTLQACHHWQALIQHCRIRRCMMQASDILVKPTLAPRPTNTTGVLNGGNFTFDDVLGDDATFYGIFDLESVEDNIIGLSGLEE